MNRYKYKIVYEGGQTATGAVMACSRCAAELIVRSRNIGIDVRNVTVWQAGKCE